jgi:SAM-dependent methyltransferase
LPGRTGAAEAFKKRVAGYSEDLAYIHDAGYGDFARGAAPALLTALRSHGINSGLVVDLGCGSGIWAERLLAAGFDVLGIDISAAMIRLAKKKAPAARFRTGSLITADVPPCVAVTAIGEVINYTFDPDSSRRTLRAFFRRVFEALRPGGMFIFDFAEPGQLQDSTPWRAHTIGRDWAVLLERSEDKHRHTLTRKITSFRKYGKLYRRTDETHVIRLYRAEELKEDLTRIGFEAIIERKYGAMPLRAATAAIYAWKPLS